MSDFDACLKNGKLVKVEPSIEMVKKEIENAGYDLKRAEESLLNDDHKWASIQAYYSMFHSAKALVLNAGYREKSHYCLLVALRELFVKGGRLAKGIGDDFEMCMDVRHQANYGLSYSNESAELTVKAAREFYDVARKMLGER